MTLICCRAILFGALLATMSSTLRAYPHQLAYFNELSGGLRAGYQLLLGSNVDWGQDLLLVREWMQANNISPRQARLVSYGMLTVYAQALVPIQAPSEPARLTIVSVNCAMDPRFSLHGRSCLDLNPVDRIGCTMVVLQEKSVGHSRKHD